MKDYYLNELKVKIEKFLYCTTNCKVSLALCSKRIALPFCRLSMASELKWRIVNSDTPLWQITLNSFWSRGNNSSNRLNLLSTQTEKLIAEFWIKSTFKLCWCNSLNKAPILSSTIKEKSKEDQKIISILMGDDVAPRKDFIISNALEVANLDI